MKEINYHYYGDKIRILFMLTGAVMAFTYPFFSSYVNLPVVVPLVFILSLAVFGGFMNPVQKWTAHVDAIVSMVSFLVFEYYAVETYLHASPSSNAGVYFFWLNQILALLFFVTTYLSVKTIRSRYIAEMEKEDKETN